MAPTRSKRRQPRHPNVELQILRINNGWSRVDLERRTGVSRETIRLAELGVFRPTPRVQFALARAFDKSPLDLWPFERQLAAA